MNDAAAALGALLVAGAAAAFAHRRLGARSTVSIRSALFVAWGVVAWSATSPSPGTPIDRPITLALSFLAIALVDARAGVMASLASMAFVAAIDALLLAPRGTRVHCAVGTAVVLAVGYALHRAMLNARFPKVRTLVHAITFGSTIGLIFPLFVLKATGRSLSSIDFDVARSTIASAIVLVAIVLGVAAAAAIVASGGTPDPLDPPPRLVTVGPYARVRHPLQIAEVLVVVAAAVAFGDRWVTLYAALFSLVLVGPMRILEEAALARRYGDAADDYRRRVPAFLPRRARLRTLLRG